MKVRARFGAMGLLWVVAVSAMAGNWPQFRGPQASGRAEQEDLPLEWDVATGKNIAWTRAIPGLAHASPIVWGDRVFLATAISDQENPILRIGLYGESPDHPEEIVHQFTVLCLDLNRGELQWKKMVTEGIPKVKRHIKSTHANCTPATDGHVVVAFFGSEGLFGLDMDGNLLWKKDLGLLDAGAFDMPSIQWGFGSSPVIHGGRVVVQCDVNNQSFLAVFDARTGEEIWKKLRDETPGWGTPTVVEVDGKTQILVNGYQHIGGYDFATGEEIWRMHGGGDIPTPTPIVGNGKVYLTSAHGRMRPVYAVSLQAKGDITLDEGQTSNDFVVWCDPRRGAYMPTPIFVDPYLYVCGDSGILTCFNAKNGEIVYRERVGHRGLAFSASAVSFQDKILFTAENGDVIIIQAGPEFKVLAQNSSGEPCLATPAIAGSQLLVRTAKHLVAVKKGAHSQGLAKAEAPAPEEALPSDQPAPEVDAKDPVSILTRVDYETRRVQSVQYQSRTTGSGALEAQVGLLNATVIATGWLQIAPERFVVDLEFQPPGQNQPVKASAGCDGERYFLLDHTAKTLRWDLESSVMGPLARAVYGAMMDEFLHPTPFSAEIEAYQCQLLDDEPIMGQPCWKIRAKYREDGDEQSTWFIGKYDFLPRGRLIHMTLPDGSEGAIFREIHHLQVLDSVPENRLHPELPEGYTFP